MYGAEEEEEFRRLDGEGEASSKVVRFYGGRVPRTPMLDVMRQTIKKARVARLEEILSKRCSSVQVLLENVQDPHNGAVCIRSADSMGLMYINVVEYFMPFAYDPELAHGSDEYVEIKRFQTSHDAVRQLKREGFSLLATTLDEDSIPISEVDFSTIDKVCILFGNEERGLSESILSQADVKIFLPMVGMVQSLNISASFAQVLYHLRTVGRIRPDLEETKLAALHEKWIINASRNPKKIIAKHNFDYPIL
uniref:tRNA/rRNA methyltransferase SpoU type domain-containing protein n=1 Tax=Rhodosorus marinus TaxID=101924 RepID=A0A7S3EHY2_9RHOD|mmetsp:Transcript_3740/g.16364  ORF Transcript_3740/g.16364 Transcript_3740/m.16364 type:complete len:251 (+) Transcript_3740:804-1556(+)